MRTPMIVMLLAVVAWLPAVERLEAGVHDIPTANEGITCTLVVPPAVSEQKPLPLVVLMAFDGKPDAKRWADWSAGSGVAVMGINGLAWIPQLAAEDEKGGALLQVEPALRADFTRRMYVASLEAVRQRIPLHPFLRYLVVGRIAAGTPAPPVVAGQPVPVPEGTPSSEQVQALLDDPQQPFGGLLVSGRYSGTLRKDVPVLHVVPGTGENMSQFATKSAPAAPKAEGPVTGYLWVGKVAGAMPFENITGGMGLLQDFASVTHERLTSIERRENLEVVAEQIQELAGLVNPIAKRAYANFLMTIPGMDKRRRDYERLMDIWLETSIIIACEHEKENLPEAHAYLCVVVRSERFKLASGKQRKSAQDELARMRKDPAIKREQAAADILADSMAMLEHDDSTAKQRIVLKDLEAMVAKYPATMAGKEAAKILETLRRNVR